MSQREQDVQSAFVPLFGVLPVACFRHYQLLLLSFSLCFRHYQMLPLSFSLTLSRAGTFLLTRSHARVPISPSILDSLLQSLPPHLHPSLPPSLSLFLPVHPPFSTPFLSYHLFLPHTQAHSIVLLLPVPFLDPCPSPFASYHTCTCSHFLLICGTFGLFSGNV